MERILVVFLRIQGKSLKEDYDRRGRLVVYRALTKTSDVPTFTNSFYLVTDRLFAVDVGLLWPTGCVKDNTSKDHLSRCEMCKNLGFRLSGRSQRKEHHWRHGAQDQHEAHRTRNPIKCVLQFSKISLSLFCCCHIYFLNIAHWLKMFAFASHSIPCSSPCRMSEPKVWIRGNTQVGPVLVVTICCVQGECGVEIRIESVKKDHSHSWVRITHIFQDVLGKSLVHVRRGLWHYGREQVSHTIRQEERLKIQLQTEGVRARRRSTRLTTRKECKRATPITAPRIILSMAATTVNMKGEHHTSSVGSWNITAWWWWKHETNTFLQDNVLISDGFLKCIYHVGSAFNLHSVINSGLMFGGQNLSKRQTVFFLCRKKRIDRLLHV